MPAVNDVGEPCAREPHARFDGRELETERLVRVTEVGQPDRKLRTPRLRDLPPNPRHRASSRPYTPWTAKTTVPVLLINTRYDPNSSYANAVAVTKRLGNAVLLTLDGYGHVTTTNTSACIERARTAYFVDLRTPAPGTVCPADHKPFH